MDSDKQSVRLKAAESLLKMVGMVAVENEIGATTIAEHKYKDMYASTDFGLTENIHGEADDYLSQFGF
jgi:hypothetical protein